MRNFKSILRPFARRFARSSPSGEARATALHHFLLVYDPSEQTVVELEEFDQFMEAANAYAAAEESRRGSDVQVVLFSSDSLDTVKQTHPHYFESGSFDFAEPFAGEPLVAPR